MRIISAPHTHRLLAASLLAACTIPATTAHAQLSLTGDIDPSNPPTWPYYTDAIVGNTGVGTMTLASGTVLDIDEVYLGFESGADGTVTVTGAGSELDLDYRIIAGYDGTGTFLVEAGGLVLASRVTLGQEPGAHGSFTVTGAGSTWDFGFSMFAGYEGTGNVLIESGGYAYGDYVYLGNSVGGSGSLTVTGVGSRFEGDDINVGRSGVGQVLVDLGGVIESESVFLGRQSGASGDATVRGAGSVWTSTSMYVGFSGSGTLLIEDGGVVNNNWDADIRSMGSATVSGAGSQWNIGGGLDVEATLLIEVGAHVSSTRADIAGPGSMVTVTGIGTQWDTGDIGVFGQLLIEAGAVVNSVDASIAGDPTPDLVTVTGAGSQWNISESLNVGYFNDGTLRIEDSAVVSVAEDVWLGRLSDDVGTIQFDSATLNTTGLLASPDELQGTGTINARTTVTDIDLTFDAASGLVQTHTFNTEPGQNITLNIDASTPFAGTGALGAGYRGTGTLRIADGHVLQSAEGYIGYREGADGTATVTGIGSRWETGRLYVGRYGTGELTIEAGAVVTSDSAYVSRISSSVGTATVTGTGSRWESTGSLFVGTSGTGSLTIENSAVVDVASTTWLGANASFSLDNGTLNTSGLAALFDEIQGVGTINTRTLISDIDLVFDTTCGLVQTMTLNSLPGQNITLNIDASNPALNEGVLGAGFLGTGTLRIADGRQLHSNSGTLGYERGSDGTATVTGAGSQWNMAGDLIVGRDGTGTLLVEAGGVVYSTQAMIGEGYPEAVGNATVTGAGSQWNVTQDLEIGGGSSGTLVVSDGGVVNSNSLRFSGREATPSSAIVTGAGSRLNIGAGGLLFDAFAHGTIRIEDGGVVDALALMPFPNTSFDLGAFNLFVNGPGSLWNSTGRLIFGYDGEPGTVLIENGGVVNTQFTQIGDFPFGSQGPDPVIVTVTGAGSQWNNAGGLLVVGETTVLNIQSGGGLNSNGGTDPQYGGSVVQEGGQVVVSGVGSQWNEAGNLILGQDGTGTLIIEAGGVIHAAGMRLVGSGSINIAGGNLIVNNDLNIQDFFGSEAALNLTLTSLADPLIDVGGGSQFDGTLNVDLAPGFGLSPIDTFTLIDIAGTRAGTFNNYDESGLLGTFNGVNLYLTYVGGDGNDVVAYAGLPGDTDLDGDIDDTDLGTSFANYTGPIAPGTGGKTWIDGDTDGDGDVDDIDLGTSFAGYTGPLSPGNVPEPGTLVLLVGAGVLGLGRRAKRIGSARWADGRRDARPTF